MTAVEATPYQLSVKEYSFKTCESETYRQNLLHATYWATLHVEFQRRSSADHQNAERVYYISPFVRSTFDFDQKQSSVSFSVYLRGFEAHSQENMADVLVSTRRFQPYVEMWQ